MEHCHSRQCAVLDDWLVAIEPSLMLGNKDKLQGGNVQWAHCDTFIESAHLITEMFDEN